MTRRQHDVRPRYGRIAGLGSSVTITVVAILGGTGVLSSAADGPSGAQDARAAIHQAAAILPPTAVDRAQEPPRTPDSSESRTTTAPDTALPAGSGAGRRVVFSEGSQRVWLVGAGNRVERTYLVSGSLTDNLDPGSYEVYSRSKLAWGIDDSGTMRYFVRFAHGDHASIGFHDIPVDDGAPVQSVDQLGTPQSHGCIRQRRGDAIALWRFAPLGTTVVVTP